MQLICLEHVRFKLLAIHLYMRSSRTLAHSWHQQFGFITIYTLLTSVWLLRENLSPSNIFDVFQNKAFLSWALEWGGRERMTKRETFVCTFKLHERISMDHFENGIRSSDRIWLEKDGNCSFVSGCVSFSITFLPLYLLLMRSPVSALELQQHSGNCLRSLGWKIHLRKFPTWELLDYPFNLLETGVCPATTFNRQLQDKRNQEFIVFLFQ